MPTVTIKFETIDFGATAQQFDSSVPSVLEAQHIPDRFGSLVTVPPSLGPRKAWIAGRIKSSDGTFASVRSQLDDFSEALGKGARGKLYFWDDRYLNCYVENDIKLTPVPGSGGLAWDYFAQFHGDDPFWYSVNSVTFTGTLTAANADATVDVTNGVYRKDYTIVNDGNAHVYPIIHVKADQGNALDQPTRLIHQGNNLTVLYNGTIAAAATAKSDHATFNFENPIGTRDMNNVASTSVFWWLEKGSNVFRLQSRPATFAVMFTPRWF